jgi:ribonuclease T1
MARILAPMRTTRRRGRATIRIVPAVLTPPRRALTAALAVLLAVLLGAMLSACGGAVPKGSATYSGGTGSGAAGSATPSDAAGLAPAEPVSHLPTMLVAQLPPEGVTTLRLIESDGPFPYDKDGATFSNREGLLPQHKSGWYQEYTVVTPGSSDRGARRIIAGRDGERYYTDDHYASFREVLSGVSG